MCTLFSTKTDLKHTYATSLVVETEEERMVVSTSCRASRNNFFLFLNPVFGTTPSRIQLENFITIKKVFEECVIFDGDELIPCKICYDSTVQHTTVY